MPRIRIGFAPLAVLTVAAAGFTAGPAAASSGQGSVHRVEPAPVRPPGWVRRAATAPRLRAALRHAERSSRTRHHARRAHRHHAGARAATMYPYFQDMRSSCGYGSISVWRPKDVRPWYAGTSEFVYWSDTLYRATATGWQQSGQTVWSAGIATDKGLYPMTAYFGSPTWLTAENGQWVPDPYALFFFNGLPHGTYRVVEHLLWSSTNQDDAHWAQFAGGSLSCSF